MSDAALTATRATAESDSSFVKSSYLTLTYITRKEFVELHGKPEQQALCIHTLVR